MVKYVTGGVHPFGFLVAPMASRKRDVESSGIGDIVGQMGTMQAVMGDDEGDHRDDHDDDHRDDHDADHAGNGTRSVTGTVFIIIMIIISTLEHLRHVPPVLSSCVKRTNCGVFAESAPSGDVCPAQMQSTGR
jgi:hypothetical protein